jgi:hypothetical protein
LLLLARLELSAGSASGRVSGAGIDESGAVGLGAGFGDGGGGFSSITRLGIVTREESDWSLAFMRFLASLSFM